MAEASGATDPGYPQTILIVEDEILTRIVLAEHLRECGYRVLEASSAVEAIAVLDSDYAVDILFTDVNLPGDMNGFALSRWAKQNRPAIKTIITSGLGRAAHAASDLCDDEPYLMKPYDPDGLVREVKRLLARKGK